MTTYLMSSDVSTADTKHPTCVLDVDMCCLTILLPFKITCSPRLHPDSVGKIRGMYSLDLKSLDSWEFFVLQAISLTQNIDVILLELESLLLDEVSIVLFQTESAVALSLKNKNDWTNADLMQTVDLTTLWLNMRRRIFLPVSSKPQFNQVHFWSWDVGSSSMNQGELLMKHIGLFTWAIAQLWCSVLEMMCRY